MPDPTPPPSAPLKIGQAVRLKGHNPVVGKVVEFRGNLGSRTKRFYRIALPSKPAPSSIELPDDEFDVVRRPQKRNHFLTGLINPIRLGSVRSRMGSLASGRGNLKKRP